MTPQFIASIVAGIVPALQPLVADIEAMSETPPGVTTKIGIALAELETASRLDPTQTLYRARRDELLKLMKDPKP